MIRSVIWNIFIPSLLAATPQQFDSNSVKYVDYNETTGNFLFMGNIPRKNDSFDKKNLIKAMKKVKNLPAKFPKKYTLVVISLLTTETQEELDFIKTIYCWFTKKKEKQVTFDDIPLQAKASSKRGLWFWWLHHGFVNTDFALDSDASWSTLDHHFGNLSEGEMEATLMDQEFKGSRLNFVDCISKLKDLMDTKDKKPYVIYFHSRRGHNRNGITAAAYLMQHKDMNLEEAWDTAVGSDNPDFFEPQYAKAFLMFFKRFLEQ